MRLQLESQSVSAKLVTISSLFWVLLCAPEIAQGDEITLRSAYYKEKSTRIFQPMIDGNFEIGEKGDLSTHALVDVITSASAAAGAAEVAFTEKRYELGASYSHELNHWRFTGSTRYSTEPDYLSLFAGTKAELELAERNTRIGVGLNAGYDTIDNSGSQGGIAPLIKGNLDTLLVSFSISQILTQNSVANIIYDYSTLNGFLENAYRTVPAQGSLERERVPDSRNRHAILGSIRSYIPPTNTVLVARYRYYRDSWGIKAHTPDIRLIQTLTPSLEIHMRYRFYSQSAATFFKDTYDSNDPKIEPFVTNDEKLTDFQANCFTFKINSNLSTFGFNGDFGQYKLSLLVEYVDQNNRFGNSIMSQMALSIPIGD